MTSRDGHGLACVRCGSPDIRTAVYDWAHCQNCGKEMSLAETMTCDCLMWDCPTLQP